MKKIKCPYCGSENVVFIASDYISGGIMDDADTYACNKCNKLFVINGETIYLDDPDAYKPKRNKKKFVLKKANLLETGRKGVLVLTPDNEIVDVFENVNELRKWLKTEKAQQKISKYISKTFSRELHVLVISATYTIQEG